jgi:hypothetical protein
MGILGSFEQFSPRKQSPEIGVKPPQVGDRVKYPAGTGEAAPAEFIGEEIAVFKLTKDAENPTPGRRVAVYEAVKGSERYNALSSDPSFTQVRTRLAAREDHEKSTTVVVPMDDLERAA